MLLEEALADLQTQGVAVVPGAFDPEQIEELVGNAGEYVAHVERSIKAGSEPDFPPFYMWWRPGLACNLTALDPATRSVGINEFGRTTLCRAVMTDPVRAVVRSEIGADVGAALVRVRAIIPSLQEGDGRLALHMEKTAVRFPGVHVIWTPLVPTGVVTNRDAPGLQFRIGNDVVRPEMRTGDIAVFNGSIEHGTHVPEHCRHWRVGCDIRLFPWTETNYLPPEAIAMGQRPERLALSSA